MAEKKPELSTYVVLSTLKHNGKYFRKDKTVQLTDKEAAPLLTLKTIEPAK